MFGGKTQSQITSEINEGTFKTAIIAALCADSNRFAGVKNAVLTQVVAKYSTSRIRGVDGNKTVDKGTLLRFKFAVYF